MQVLVFYFYFVVVVVVVIASALLSFTYRSLKERIAYIPPTIISAYKRMNPYALWLFNFNLI